MQHPEEQADTPMGRALARRMVQMPHRPGLSITPGVRLDLTLPDRRPMFPALREAVKDSLSNGQTHYTARTGIEPLRAAIAERSSAEGFPATAESTVVTNGGSEALYIALQTLVSGGDRVLLVEPVSPRVTDVVRFIGGEPEPVTMPDASSLPGASTVVVCAPSGISGQDVPDSDLVELIEAADREGVAVVVDRSAAPDRYEQVEPFPQPNLAAGVVTVGSFSGAYGLGGWRVGYFTAPASWMDRLAGLKESMSISTTTPSQFAALAALEHAEEILADARAHAGRRRDIAAERLKLSGIPFVSPTVYPGLLIDIRRSGLADVRFADQLLAAADVRVEPGSRYGASLAGFVRLDLRAPEEALTEGVARLASFMKGLS